MDKPGNIVSYINVSQRWTNQETLFPISMFPKDGQTRKHCFLYPCFPKMDKPGNIVSYIHVSQRWTNLETLFPSGLVLAMFSKGGQTRKHCFLAMFPIGEQTMKHCFLAISFPKVDKPGNIVS
jgi:hypothetical protein